MSGVRAIPVEMPKNAGYALVERSSVRDHDTETETAAAIAAKESAADNTAAGLVAQTEAHAARRYRAWRVVLFLGLLLAMLVILTAGTGRSISSSDQIVILVSCDGFRSDYRYRAGPAMRRLMAEGVQAEFMRPAFPSKTFPNHYSLVTGLWPESHGIVGNSFMEPSTGQLFSMRSKESFFWRGEPLWVTAEKAGVRSAPGMWPGADVNMSSAGAPGSGFPSYSLAYTRSIDNLGRVLWLLEQLARPPEAQPRFLTLYMEDLDDAGHQHGPDSPEVAAALLDVDTGLQALLDGVNTLREETRRRLNIVVVGDHGMVGTSTDRCDMQPMFC